MTFVSPRDRLTLVPGLTEVSAREFWSFGHA